MTVQNWVITKVPNLNRIWRVANKSNDRIAEITIDRANSGGWDALVHFEKAKAFDWKWNYTSQTEAMTGACGYIRGVERAVEVHHKETSI
jgi:hypothetical protein